MRHDCTVTQFQVCNSIYLQSRTLTYTVSTHKLRRNFMNAANLKFSTVFRWRKWAWMLWLSGDDASIVCEMFFFLTASKVNDRIKNTWTKSQHQFTPFCEWSRWNTCIFECPSDRTIVNHYCGRHERARYNFWKYLSASVSMPAV